MRFHHFLGVILLAAFLPLIGCATAGTSNAEKAAAQKEEAAADARSYAELTRDSQQALASLYGMNEKAREIGSKAKAVLIFPSIGRAGFILGGSFGRGTLFVDGKVEGHYRSVSASWGLQAGIQAYSYAVFLMTDSALEYLRASYGWELGTGPTLVIADEGFGRNMSTTTLKDDAYAFIFGQEGLMAGLGIQGTKVTKIDK